MRVDADDFARPCSCGKEHHIDVKEILIEEGAIERLAEEMSDGFLKNCISPLVICDTNTYEATEEIMEDIYDRCQILDLDAEDLHADEYAVEIVENIMDDDIDLILAVGTGTIHDIARFVAARYKVPFVSVPTAANVTGFLSTTAEMNWNGVKKTIPTDIPVAVYADTRIFAKAPNHLTALGVSNLLAKYTALKERINSRKLLAENNWEEAVEFEEKILKELKTAKNCLGDARAGDEDACEKLMRGLILSDMFLEDSMF